MNRFKIKVFKVKEDSIVQATDGYCSMNYDSDWFRSSVINIEKNDGFYLVTVKSTFDYPYITNHWDNWIIKEKYKGDTIEY